MRSRIALSLITAVTTAALLVAAERPQQDGPKLISHSDNLTGRWIVTLADDATGPTGPRSKAPAVAHELQGLYGGTVHHVWKKTLNGFVATMSKDEAAALSQDPAVVRVEQERMGRVQTTQTSPGWGLDRVDQRSLPVDSSYTYPMTGTSVHVYLIDSGILASHNEFGGRAIQEENWATDGNGGDDCAGHGTQVAGIIAGSTTGVAKGVKIHSLRVNDCGGYYLEGDLISALEWVLDYWQPPAVVNISMAGNGNAAVDSAVRAVISAGVPVVVSAGQGSEDASNLSPARVIPALTVSGTDSTDARAFLTFHYCNYGSVVDLFAPGKGLRTASATGDSDYVTNGQGTSLAAPFVTGVVALYLEDHPSATPAQVASALIGNATTNVVSNAGAGTPNRLLYSGFLVDDVLEPEEYLYAGDEVTSGDGSYHFIYQTDGNLVLYNSAWTPLWSSGTSGTSAGFVAMQTDGNLVLYDAGGTARFSSGSYGHDGARLIIQGDGNAVIYAPNGTVLWSTGT